MQDKTDVLTRLEEIYAEPVNIGKATIANADEVLRRVEARAAQETINAD